MRRLHSLAREKQRLAGKMVTSAGVSACRKHLVSASGRLLTSGQRSLSYSGLLHNNLVVVVSSPPPVQRLPRLYADCPPLKKHTTLQNTSHKHGRSRASSLRWCNCADMDMHTVRANIGHFFRSDFSLLINYVSRTDVIIRRSSDDNKTRQYTTYIVVYKKMRLSEYCN